MRLAAAATGIVLFFNARTRAIRRHNAELQREITERKRAEEESQRHWSQLARVSPITEMLGFSLLLGAV